MITFEGQIFDVTSYGSGQRVDKASWHLCSCSAYLSLSCIRLYSMPTSSPGLRVSSNLSEGVGVGSSSNSGSVGMSLKVLGVGSEVTFLGELVLAAFEACKLCCVGMGCWSVDCLSAASSAFSPWSSLNML